MSSEKSKSDFEQLAKLVLNRYPIKYEEIHWLGHSENISFKIVSKDKKYLLRLHMPLVSFREVIWIEKKIIESEIIWLQALGGDTNLLLANPISNEDQEFVTQITMGEKIINASLLSWIDGEHLQGNRSISQGKELANLLAVLHNHSMNWKPAADFNRPSYDLDLLSKKSIDDIRHLIDLGIVSKENFNLIEKTINQAKNEIVNKLPINNTNWGIIHGDLHENNYIISRGKMAPIDFSCCGYGYYQFDLATTMLHLDAGVHEAFLTEYIAAKNNFSENDVKLIDAFIIIAIARNFAFLSKNPNEYEYLTEGFLFYINLHCIPYLKKENI